MRPINYVWFTALALSGFVLANGCSTQADSDGGARPGVRVTVQEVQLSQGGKRYRYSGTIEEYRTYSAAFSVAGIVRNIEVHEGQAVQKGQLLASLNDASVRQTYAIAEATYQRAVDAVERLRPMHENGNLPDIKMVEAETGLAQATASLELVKKNLQDCQLYALECGVVGKCSIDLGEGVIPGVPVVTVVQMDSVYAVISVHENEIGEFAPGMRALVEVSAQAGRRWEGTVREIGVIADPLSHTYKVKILVDNADHRMRSGMISTVSIFSQGSEKVVAVPNETVQVDNQGGTFVYVVDQNSMTVKKQAVSLGRLLEDGLEITHGLEVNDIVVVAGQQRLYENAPISIVQAATQNGEDM